MSDRVYASIIYIGLIVGSSWIAVEVGEALTREVLAKLAVLRSHDDRPSRVELYLAAQEHPDQTDRPKKTPLIPAAPSITVGALAKGMDDAEQINAIQVDPAETPSEEAHQAQQVTPKRSRSRIAGWTSRAPKRAIAVSAREETANRIIMRALRAGM